MRKLNVAIVGCGAISSTHINAIKQSPDATLYAVCDIEELKAAKVAWEQNCRYYIDFDEMLEEPEIDVIHICTPHYLHFPMVCKSLRKGKHVFTEKPLGLNEKECIEMKELATRSDYKACVCLQNRLNATSKALKDIVSQETYGKILGMRAFVSWHRDETYYKDSPWKGKWKYEGGGLLMNQMIHTLDLMQWLGGPIRQIKGHVSNRLLQEIIEEEDTAEATLWFENGTQGSFYGTNTYSTDSSVLLELHMEKGILRIQDGELVVIRDGSKEFLTSDASGHEGKWYWGASHKEAILQFYDAIIQEHDNYMKLEEGVTSVQMCQAIYQDTFGKTRE